MLLAVTIGMGDAISIGVAALLGGVLVGAVRLSSSIVSLVKDLTKAEERIKDLEDHDKSATTARHGLELRIHGLEQAANHSGVYEAP